jgi:hypothetical protein
MARRRAPNQETSTVILKNHFFGNGFVALDLNINVNRSDRILYVVVTMFHLHGVLAADDIRNFNGSLRVGNNRSRGTCLSRRKGEAEKVLQFGS